MSKPKPHPCCNVEGNLSVVEKRRISGKHASGADAAGDLTVRQCKVCGSKHHNVAVDPVEVRLKT